MKQTLYIDPRIRDYVFFPLIILMIIVALLRYYITKLMYAPDNALLQPANLSFRALKKTIFEKLADFTKEDPGQIDVIQVLDQVKSDVKDNNALARSTRIRKACEYLPEDAVKVRKAYFCKENEGYLNKKVGGVNPMAMMNPDMMSNMMKQNVQGMFNIFLFSVVGSFFSGFIIAQVPFPLGQKFKAILQQGLNLQALDPSYVSSMSWCFLLIFGLQGLMNLILGDSDGMDDMNSMMPNPAQMMGGQPGMEQKNFAALFKSEKENYEILNYKFRLEDAEDAFLYKYKKNKN
eukprot:403352504